jgi:hypothetical protein
MTVIFGAQGVFPNPRGQSSIAMTLQPGLSRLIPAGTWQLSTDGYSCVQEFDPVQDQWIAPGGGGGSYANQPDMIRYINSDGNNYRVINLCGCIVGAIVSTAGSGYTTASPPTVSFTNATNAAAVAIVGGAVSTSVTVTNAGTSYTYPPLILLDSPPYNGVGGYQATGYSTLSGTTLSSITIDNQGAGYVQVPNIYIINDPRDTTGSGASAVATLTGAGTVTQLVITNIGNPNTTLFPTIAFSSGSAAAFPIMVKTVSGLAITTSGSGYTGTQEITSLGSGINSTANILTNPKWTTNLVRTRKASIIGALTTGGAFTGGATLVDGGIYAGSNFTVMIYGSLTTGAGPAPATLTLSTSSNPNSTVTLQPV